ncbi:MAG: hypothetical protein KGY99_00265 [Phycisphaerae bacterium]|nr:hypothetical protein [Phycisphaerae bacterium]
MEPLRRGKNVALAGAGFQVVLSVLMLLLWLWIGSLTAMSAMGLLVVGAGVWLMAAVLMYCRQLESREEVELDELAAGRGESVFAGDETDRPAAERRRWFDKWVSPAFTLLWAILHALIAVVVIRSLIGREAANVTDPLPGVVFLAVASFAAFLFGRYVIGMSRDRRWHLLRAPASYLLGNVIVMVTTMAALAASHWAYAELDRYLAFVAPALQVLLAVELALNFVLDRYRPRVPGQEQRPSFDSRLLNIAAEPDKIGHSLAEALNYQFGFEVSGTWFYQLLQRAFVPLLLSGVAVLVAVSSVVIVPAGEVGIVKRWGRLDRQKRTLNPGVHMKWFWPVETVQRLETAKLQDIQLGTGAPRTAEDREKMVVKGVELYLWTEEHGRRKERDFLLAASPKQGERQDEQHGVTIIKLVVSVKYRIVKPYAYAYGFVDAHGLLESIAYREMTHYASRATLDEPVGAGEANRPEAIMTYGRARAADALQHRIQDAVDALDMGVAIERVQIISAHPPKEVAPAFEKVLQAERGREQQRYQAQADANRTLSAAAGRPQLALELAHQIRTVTDLEGLSVVRNQPKQFAARLQTYIAQVTEEIAQLDKEIAYRRQRGRVGEGIEGKRDLRKQYDEYKQFLDGIADPQTFDFNAEIADRRATAEAMLATAGGELVQIIEEAKVYRWTKELTVRSQVDEIARQIPSYRAAPDVYALDQYLDVWERYAPDLPKYILAADRDKVEMWLNWEPKIRAGAGMGLGQQSPTGQ